MCTALPIPRNVQSISEYVEHVTTVSSNWGDEDSFITPWFRGIGNGDTYKLLPGLYRASDINHLHEERKIRGAFASRALPYLSFPHQRAPWEWYFLMQHYGVPTRLLDWTESALVALYFAIAARKPGQTAYPAVWVLDPFALNRITIGADQIYSQDDGALAAYLPTCSSREPPKLPVAIHPDYTDRRMHAQHSKFTMHGSNATPLEDIPTLRELRVTNHLVQITINTPNDEAVDDFKRSLALLGIRNSTVFPDLMGLAKDIKQDYTPTLE